METQQQEQKNFAQRNGALFSSAKEDWATPQDFFDKLNEEFGFDLDPCASEENHKCEHYFTKQENGLLKDWGGGIACFAIHLMAEYRRANGSRSAQKKRRSQIQPSFCLYLPELTHKRFTNIFTTKRKFAL